MSFVLIPTKHAEHLAQEMTLPAGSEVLYLQGNKEGERVFPDGEVYVQIPAIEANKRVVILHAGAPDPNEGLVELELVLSALIEAHVKSIKVFFSYFPYGMQDHAKHEGEINAAEQLIRKLVEYYKVQKIWVLDAHFFGQPWVEKYPVHHISATTLLKEAARMEYPSAVFLAPDAGSQRRLLLQGTTKNRINSFEVDMVHDESFVELVQNQVVAVVDDVVETGGTAVAFAELCKKVGATEVIALITHGLLPSGVERVQKSYGKAYVTNSIGHSPASVDVSGLILERILSA